MTNYHVKIDADHAEIVATYPIDTDYDNGAFTYDKEKHSFFDFMDKTHPASLYHIGDGMMFDLEGKAYVSNVVYVAKMRGTTRVFTNHPKPYDGSEPFIRTKVKREVTFSLVNEDGTLKPVRLLLGGE